MILMMKTRISNNCILRLNKSRLMDFLIHSSILNFYFCSHDVYIFSMHNIYLVEKFVLDHTVMLARNSTPVDPYDEEKDCKK